MAAFLTCFSVIHIQLSHFFAVDTFSTTFVLATIYYSLKTTYEGGRKNSLLTGVMFGFALDYKISVMPLIVPVIISHIIFQFSETNSDRLIINYNRIQIWNLLKKLFFLHLLVC